MTPEKEAELFAKIGLMITLVQARGEGIARIEDRLDGIDDRLNDQGRILAAVAPAPESGSR